jgi:2'-5' RNA ligase
MRPLVLVGGQSLQPVRLFQQRLREVLLGGHLPPPDPAPFVPHVTLLRDDRQVPEQPVEPLCWRARDFVLVRSLQGRGQHQVLARFPLQD